MAYKKTYRDLSDLPTRCPTCDDKRTDPAAVAVHNVLAAATGCRKYPQRRAYA